MADVQSNIDIRIDTSSALSSIKLLQSQLSAFQNSMSKSSAANAATAANMQQNLINNINATGKFNASIRTVKSTTESFTNALEKNKLSLGEYFKYSTASTKSFGRVFKTEFDTINKVARERVKDLQTQYIKLGRDANGAMKAIAVRPLALDMDALGTKTAIAAQRQQLLNQMLKQGSTNLLNFGKNTQWAGRQLMVGFTIPIGLAGAAAAKAFMDIEKASVKIRRVYGDLSTTAKETNSMVEQIKTLASEYTKYGIAVAETMEMAATAAAMGKTGADLLAQVASASKLAALGGVDQNKALLTTISITDAFGISADKLAGKINFLNAVENQTVTSIEDLTIAVPKAGPVIQQLGGDVEDLAFLLTAMREGGINASEGANALKSGLAALINPTGKAVEMLASYGINVREIVDSNKGDVKKTVVDFAKALDTLDPLNRARAIEQMFGKFQFARLSTLFQNVNKEGSQASKALELANMSSIKLAAISARELQKLESSPMFKFQKSLADLQTKIAPIGETFLKAVTPVINFVSKILDGFNGMSDSFRQFVVVGIAVVGGLAPVLLMLVGLVANGAANIIKLFANIKSFFNGASSATNILGEETRYMTQEQIQAAAVAASLDQTHTKLIQTFTSEASAVRLYAEELRRANVAAAAFNVPAVGRSRPARKMASGGTVPGMGSGDTVPAMLTPGEFVVKKKVAKKSMPFLQALNSGKIPGFAEGGMVPAFTNAVAMLRSGTNQALKGGGMSGSALSSEFSQLGGGINAPIVSAIANALGAKNNKQIVAMLKNDPSLAEFANSITTGVANELGQVAGNVDDPKLGAIYQKVARAEAQKRGELYATTTEKFFTDLTTFEDISQQRTRSSGRTMPIGRATLFKNTPSYRSKNYSPVVSELGTDPTGLVKAHMTERKFIDLQKMEMFGKELSNQAKAASSRLQAGIVKTYQSVQSAILDGVKQATKTASPSKETSNVGKDIGQGFINGGREKIDDAKVVGKQIGNAVVQGATQSGATRAPRRASQPAGQTVNGQFLPVGFTPSDGYKKPIGPKMPFMQNAKRNINLVKSGKKTISGGKIAGAGFGASMAMGAASMIPGPIGQFAATLSPIIAIMSMFGGVISKILPFLLKFAGPIGLAITAIGGLIAVVNNINEAKKKETEKTNAVATAADSASKALSGGLSKAVGLSGTNNLLNAAAGKAQGIGVKELNDVNTLLESDEFRTKVGKDGEPIGETGKFINDLKKVTSTQAVTAILDSVAMGLLSQGATDQVVTDTITAIRVAAGKKDLTFDVKSIKLGTTGGQNALKKNVDALAADISKSSSNLPRKYKGLFSLETEVDKGSDQYAKMKAAASAYGTVVSQLSTSISQMFASGQISAKDFDSSMLTLRSGFNKLSTDAKRLVIAQAFKDMPEPIRKVKDSLKSTADQMKYLLIVSLGGDISQSVIDGLNSADATVRATAQKQFNKSLDDAKKYAKEVDKLVGEIAAPDSSGSGGNAATNLKAQLAEQIKQSRLSRQLMSKGASKDFAEFLSKADRETRAQYVKAGTNQLNTAGKALQSQYATAGLEEFRTKQTTLLSNLRDEKATRDALVAANVNYLDAAKAATDETVRAAIASAMLIKNDVLRQKSIAEIIRLMKISNGEQQKADMAAVNTAQAQSIKDSYNQVEAYNKLIKAGSGAKAAYEAVQDAATAAAISQETNTEVLKAYIKQARILQAIQQKAKGADQAKIDFANLKIDVKQAEINGYQDALSLLQAEEQKINDVYEKRVEALDEIIAANEKISAQQQGQLDLASALARGDMAGAAKAAMDIRQQAAKSALDEQKKLLSDAKQAQIDSLTITVNGQTLTMRGLTDQITNLTNEINRIKLNEINQPAQNIARDNLNNAITPGTEDQVIKDNGGLGGLVVDNPAPAPVASGPYGDLTNKANKPTAVVPGKTWVWSNLNNKWGLITTTKLNTAGSGGGSGTGGTGGTGTKLTLPESITGSGLQGVPTQTQLVQGKVSFQKQVSGLADTFFGNLGDAFAFKPYKFSDGGMVPKYLSRGGFPGMPRRGTDTVPAMLTPGEFVVKKYAVDKFGVDNLKAINNGSYQGDSVYNYNLSVNAGTNASTDDIARAVMAKIKQVDSQRIRGNTF